LSVAVLPNKQLQPTVEQHRGDAASAPFHYALAARITRRRAAADLRR
jgi:predicted N-formylglutamate amidohydrolase